MVVKVTDPRVCRDCHNVFSVKVGGVAFPSTPCPVCKSVNSDKIFND